MTDLKITQLTAMTTVDDSDLIAIVNDPTGSAQTQRITRANLLDSKLISTDLGIANKTAGTNMPISGNSIIDSDVQLTGSTADGFPTTPTSVWNMDSSTDTAIDGTYAGTKVGAYDLTIKGEKLTTGADALGNSKYCQFQGAGYLQSTNAVFDFSGSWSAGFKMLLPDWTPTKAVCLMSNAGAGAAAGFRLRIEGTAGGSGLYYEENGVNIISKISLTGLDATKFHDFTLWRTSGGSVYLFIDGVCVGTGTAGTITAQQLFQISGYNGATELLASGSRVDEVWVDKVNTPTADALRNIYARSAKKFAVKDQNSNVIIGNSRGVNIYKTLAADSVTNSAVADKSLISVVVPEDGLYEMIAAVSGVGDAGTDYFPQIRIGATWGTATLVAKTPSNCYTGYQRYDGVQCQLYLTSGSTIQLGIKTGMCTSTVFGDSSNIGATSIIVKKVD